MQSLKEQVKIIDLLMEREQAFIRIRDIEQRLQTLLGQAYPLPPVPALPSRIPKGKLLNSAKKNTFKQKLRPLRANETAYRVLYIYENEEKETLEYSYEMLQELLRNPTSFLTILQIKILTIDEEQKENEIEIYRSPEFDLDVTSKAKS